MNYNPYTPPAAAVADHEGDALPPRKPWAVTIAQVVGAVLVVTLVIGMTRSALAIAESQKLGFTFNAWYWHFGMRIALFTAVSVMLIQLPKRSQISRWCGVLLILVVLTLPFYLVVTVKLDNTDNLWNLVGYLTGFLITFLPIAYWLYAFAFSRKARAYFRDPARN